MLSAEAAANRALPSCSLRRRGTSRRSDGGRNYPAARCESSGTKVANLRVSHKESIPLPEYADDSGRSYRISEFLSHPSGTESILNARALQSIERLETDTFRCTLPAIQFLKFEVVPVVVLRVTTSSEDCVVEMVSCEFGGSQNMERQQSREFSAVMRNRITWDEDSAEHCLHFDVHLGVALPVYTPPFTMLPVSAVETPGNLIMRRLIDALFPLLVEQLLHDYRNWVEARCHS